MKSLVVWHMLTMSSILGLIPSTVEEEEKGEGRGGGGERGGEGL
jgi:hypothetical protein